MSTAKMVALMLFIVSLLIFGAVGFLDATLKDFNLIAVGLFFFVAGFVLDKYVP